VPTSPYAVPSGGPLVPSVGPGSGVVVPASPRPTDLPPPSIDLPRGANLGPSAAPPLKPGSELMLPEPLPGAAPSKSQYPAPAPLRPADGVLGGPTGPGAKAQSPEPPVAQRATSPAAAVIGLPGFTKLKDGVAAGRRPTLEGFDWLKQNGYRTVVVLHAPGADLASDRELAEKKGLAFVPIEATPETLADALARFNTAVADRSSRPAYVYDDHTGLRVGAVAYLHFVTADVMATDAARIRAAGLGLGTDTEEAKAFWVAINDYLAKR
jgi:hypothetical protein